MVSTWGQHSSTHGPLVRLATTAQAKSSERSEETDGLRESSFFAHAKITITNHSPPSPDQLAANEAPPSPPEPFNSTHSVPKSRSTGFSPSSPDSKMSSALARPLMRTTARTLPSRVAVRCESTTTKKATDATKRAADAAKDATAKASELSAKAAQGLSRAASAAGPAISGAVNALGKAGGRTGKVINFMESTWCQGARNKDIGRLYSEAFPAGL